MGDDARAGPLRVHAVIRQPLAGRARRWLGSRASTADVAGEVAVPGLEGVRRLAHGGLSAVVSPVAGADEDAATAEARLDRHARIVEALADPGPVVPAPPGLHAADEEGVRAFLDRAGLALEEALDLFDGACEIRLHVRPHPGRRATDRPRSPADDGDPRAAAVRLYHRLRRHARASRRLPVEDGDLLTAAFLVGRAGWREGKSVAARWQEDQPDLVAKVSGPWAPYDFVRMFPVEAP